MPKPSEVVSYLPRKAVSGVGDGLLDFVLGRLGGIGGHALLGTCCVGFLQLAIGPKHGCLRSGKGGEANHVRVEKSLRPASAMLMDLVLEKLKKLS
jgi:hypothetical protein